MKRIPRPTNALKILAAAANVPNFSICSDWRAFELRSKPSSPDSYTRRPSPNLFVEMYPIDSRSDFATDWRPLLPRLAKVMLFGFASCSRKSSTPLLFGTGNSCFESDYGRDSTLTTESLSSPDTTIFFLVILLFQ